MSQRKKITLGLLGLAAMVGAVWLLWTPPEPVFQGVPISKWLDAVRTGSPVGTVRGQPLPKGVPESQAREAVAAIGPAALPYIAEASAGETSILSKIYWRLYLAAPGPIVRRLPWPPARGRPFRPEVTAGLFYAATKNAGTDAIPKLTSLANARRADVRRSALLCLLLLAPKDPGAALPAIQKALHDEDPSVRFFAFKYLCKVAENEPAAKQSIADFLKEVGTNAPEWMREEGAKILDGSPPKDHSTLATPERLVETVSVPSMPYALARVSKPQRSIRSVVSQEMQASVIETP